MRLLLLMLLLAYAGCNNPSPPTAVTANPDPATGKETAVPAERMPAAVTEYIRIHLPGWQMTDTADYDKSWWSFYDKNYNPCFVTTDINDDQLADHALLLKKKNLLRLVFLTGTGEQTFSHFFAEDFKPGYGKKVQEVQFGLLAEPPAQIDVVYPEERSLLLAANGITLVQLEEKLRVYYWEDGTIKVFYMK